MIKRITRNNLASQIEVMIHKNHNKRCMLLENEGLSQKDLIDSRKKLKNPCFSFKNSFSWQMNKFNKPFHGVVPF